MRQGGPPLRIIDFADGLLLVDNGGAGDHQFAGLARPMSPLVGFGIRYHDKEGKCRRPRQSTPWIRFVVDTRLVEVQFDPAKRGKGMSSCGAIMGPQASSRKSVSAILPAVSYLNFLWWMAPGGFCRLRGGWNVVNGGGATGKWHAGWEIRTAR